MFEYTKLVFNQTVNDIKRISIVTDYAMQIVYIAYLIYAICVSDIMLGVNIALLVISFSYLVFSVIMRVKELKKTDRNIKKKVKQAYKVSKYIVQVPILVTAIITLTNLEDDKVTFSLLFTIMMIVCYVASILMALTTNVLESRAKRFTVAIEADLEPIISVVNTVKRFKGEKIEVAEADKTKEKIRSELDEKVDKIREERSEIENQVMSKADKSELWETRKERTPLYPVRAAFLKRMQITPILSRATNGTIKPIIRRLSSKTVRAKISTVRNSVTPQTVMCG